MTALTGRQVFDLNININRIGRHRKGDSVTLKLKANAVAEAAEALRAFARNYLVTAKFSVYMYTDGTWGIGDENDDEKYGSGFWEIVASTV